MVKLQEIAREYLQSIPFGTTKEEQDEQSIKEALAQGKVKAGYLKKLHKRELTELVFNEVLTQSERLRVKLSREKTPILEPESWRDFNLLRGSTTAPEKSVLNRIKRTRTIAGECVFATELVNPYGSVEAIRDKQEVVKALIENKSASMAIDKSLGQIAKREGTCLSHWGKEHELNHPVYKKELKPFYYATPQLRRFNRSSRALQIQKVFSDFWLNPMLGLIFSMLLLYPVLYWIFGWGGQRAVAYLSGKVGKSVVPGLVPISFQLTSLLCALRTTVFGLSGKLVLNSLIPGFALFMPLWWSWGPISSWYDWYPNLKIEFPKIKFYYWKLMLRLPPSAYQYYLETNHFSTEWLLTFVAFSFLIPGLIWYRAYTLYRMKKSTLNLLRSHLAAFQELVLGAAQIIKVVDQDPRLKKKLAPQLVATRRLFQPYNESCPKSTLVYNLVKANYDSTAYFAGDIGSLLQTYTLLKEERSCLNDLIYEIGYVDHCRSVARLVEEGQANPKCGLVPAHFERESVLGIFPKLKIKGMRHPQLVPRKAVTNNLTMDAEGGPSMVVLTGPNAGGKSTYITSVGVNVVFGQTIGWVMAKAFTQEAPFAKIISYINVAQDLAAGLSLGEAGMEVLKKHKQVLDKMTKQGVLAIVDEILNGTDPMVTEPLVKEILEQRQKNYPRCLTLLTTHYMGITKLAEKHTTIINKKVVVRMPGSRGRKFDYTYKIEPGIADQNIAREMLVAKGVL